LEGLKKQSQLNENCLIGAFREPVEKLEEGNLRNNKLKIMKKRLGFLGKRQDLDLP